MKCARQSWLSHKHVLILTCVGSCSIESRWCDCIRVIRKSGWWDKKARCKRREHNLKKCEYVARKRMILSSACLLSYFDDVFNNKPVWRTTNLQSCSETNSVIADISSWPQKVWTQSRLSAVKAVINVVIECQLSQRIASSEKLWYHRQNIFYTRKFLIHIIDRLHNIMNSRFHVTMTKFCILHSAQTHRVRVFVLYNTRDPIEDWIRHVFHRRKTCFHNEPPLNYRTSLLVSSVVSSRKIHPVWELIVVDKHLIKLIVMHKRTLDKTEHRIIDRGSSD